MLRIVFVLLLCASAPAVQASGIDWPQYRGPQASGVSEGYELPQEWDLESGKNIKWQVSTPGLGHSSPVIWGDKLFLTTAVRESGAGQRLRLGIYGDIASVEDQAEHTWKVLCYDKNTGDLLWERDVHAGIPEVKRHAKSSHANPTAATDGKRLVAFFGSEGLYCLDLDGKLLWSRDFGVLDSGYFRAPEAQWGFGSSPVIHQDKVVILADHTGQSFLTVLRLEDGTPLWRVARDESATWGTPLVVTAGGRTQVVVNGYRHAGGYDFETGEELWKIRGGGDIPVPTPIYGKGLFFFTSAHGRMSPVYAVGAEFRSAGAITPESAEGVAWIARRTGSYMHTPLLLDDLLYVPRWRGVLICLRPETGKVVYEKRLGPGAFTSSPVAGDGKIYIASEEGEVYVVAAGEQFRVVAKNSLRQPTLASPAISEGVIYYRTSESLIAIEIER